MSDEQAAETASETETPIFFEPDPDLLGGKRLLITGAASGLGLATALMAGAAGARVFCADINEGGAAATAEQIDGYAMQVDVSSMDENKAMVAAAEDALGGIDHAFLNAGVSTGCGIGDDFDMDLYRRANGANLDGVIFGTHAVMPALKRAGGGSIVATASLAGLTAVPFDPIYAANKHGVVGMVRSAGALSPQDDIRINAICPGFADTAIIAPFREQLLAEGFSIIPAETVASTVLRLFTGTESGECWFVQPGREPAAFGFRNLPGPR
jgi:NAD(P)-dependent dehydrogenase (short-subunit alcohol dehydrogenase family)